MYRMYDCDFRWPNGAYIAVVFNMSWETPEHAVGEAKREIQARDAADLRSGVRGHGRRPASVRSLGQDRGSLILLCGRTDRGDVPAPRKRRIGARA